eukprot:7764895-Karenia_brevis.AAC.1
MSSYAYFGIPVCRKAFLSLWACSNTRLRRLAQHAQEGNPEAPYDLRKARDKRLSETSSECAKTADLFWMYAYEHIAENLAEGDGSHGLVACVMLDDKAHDGNELGCS